MGTNTKPLIQIKNRAGSVIFEGEDETLLKLVERACRECKDLRGAYLGGAGETVIDWTSHDLVAELLRRSAGDDVQKSMVAGLILISLDWCWTEFLAIETPLRAWALDTLRPWVREGDNAPIALRNHVVPVERLEVRDGG